MRQVQSRATVRVKRGTPGAEPRYDTWEVPYEEGMTVLDALLWIRRNVDPTLAVRCSCLNANACKECVAIVNGRSAYLCTVRLGDLVMTCEPLPNKRLVRDLVVDLTSASEQMVGS